MYFIIKEYALLMDLQKLEKVEIRIVSIFVMDKRAHKICHSTKDTVINSLTFLEVKPQRVTKGIFHVGHTTTHVSA